MISENYETLGATKTLAFCKSGTNFFTVFLISVSLLAISEISY